jgi:hypothetical protein
MAKLPISVVILSWGNCDVLYNTLTTYKENGLFDMINDVNILFQEVTDRDVQITRHFGLDCIGLHNNIGIGKALNKLVNVSQTENVLILENDWNLIENTEVTFNRLQSGLDLLNGGYDVVKYRHRKDYGNPLFSLQFKDKELEEYDSWSDISSPHLFNSIHWVEKPEEKFKGLIEKKGEYFSTTSRYGNWTNNPCLYKKNFYLSVIKPFMGEGIDLEQKIAHWWPRQNFKMAHGEGLFKHNDFTKY